MRRRSSEPDPRFHVSVVCTGNICRSPMAAIVLRDAIDKAGLADRVRVTSSGTGPWHVGGPAHASTRAVLEAAGYSAEHVARQIDRAELRSIDLVLAADNSHLIALRAMDRGSAHDRIVLFRSLDPAAAPSDLDLPDPFGGPDEGFAAVMAMVQAAVPGILDEIRSRLDRLGAPDRADRR